MLASTVDMHARAERVSTTLASLGHSKIGVRSRVDDKEITGMNNLVSMTTNDCCSTYVP